MNFQLQKFSILDLIDGIINQKKIIYLLIFLIAFLIRLIPELIISTYPVGFETITYYAPAMTNFSATSSYVFFDLLLQFINSNQSLSNIFRSGPIFYLIMFFIVQILDSKVFLVLKVAGPILYGFFAISFYYFLIKTLRFSTKKSILSILFLIFQIATLRLIWDRYRTILALSFFFFALTYLSKKNSIQKWVSIAIFGLLITLTRDYIGLLLLIVVLGNTILKKEDFLKTLIALVPSFLVLLVIMNPGYLNWNYLSSENPFFIQSYFFGVQDSLVIFVICYLIMIPFVIKGYFSNKLLNLLLLWLGLGSFGLIFFPWFAIPGYQRWLMLLVIPLTIYATNGFTKIKLGKHGIKFKSIIFSIIVLIGIFYSSGIFSYTGFLPNSYVPINLTCSSIPWTEVNDIKQIIFWFNDNIYPNSTLVIEERFYGWAQLYIDHDFMNVTIVPYSSNLSVYSVLSEVNAKQRYFIWYSGDVISNSKLEYSFGNLSLFSY